MAVQTNYGQITDHPAFAGKRIGTNFPDNVRPLTAGGASQKVSTITVTLAVNDTPYAYTVVGEAIGYTSDAVATLPEIADGLAAAHNANSTAAARCIAVSDGVDTVTITAVETDDDFAISEADANLTLATPTAASAGSAIPFGIGVQEPTIGEIQLPGTGGDPFAGVALKTQLQEGTDTGATIPAGDVASVMAHGACWVLLDAGEAPAAGDSVYYRATAGAGEQLGAFRASNDDGGDSLICTNCRWVRSATTDPDGNLIAGLMVQAN
jgi:hypothetical protein